MTFLLYSPFFWRVLEMMDIPSPDHGIYSRSHHDWMHSTGLQALGIPRVGTINTSIHQWMAVVPQSHPVPTQPARYLQWLLRSHDLSPCEPTLPGRIVGSWGRGDSRGSLHGMLHRIQCCLIMGFNVVCLRDLSFDGIYWDFSWNSMGLD